LIEGILLYTRAKIGELWPRRYPWSAKILKDIKNVTLFSYIIWLSAMKFGTMRVISYFGEL